MADTLNASRSQVILGVCVPLAVLVGYFAANPMESSSMAIIVMVLTALCLPLLMRWYHPLLVLTWNAAITPFFLPGRPYLWMLIAGLGLLVAVVNRSMDPDRKFLPSGSVPFALLALGIVVLVTASMTGGIGTRTMGSETFGGKKYFYIWAAIVGYFALISQKIPRRFAGWYVALFFLSGLTALVGNLAYMGGTKFYFLFELFPPEYAATQASGVMSPFSQMVRIAGTIWTSLAILSFLLARYGVRGIFDVTRPWRLALLIIAFGGGLLSGFRSFAILFALIFLVAFVLEGLHRTRWLPLFLGLGVVVGVATLPFVDRLPLSAQRALSFLPVQIHPAARGDAEYSTEWRVEMWRMLMPEVPKHLLVGKGYSMDPNELLLSEENAARRFSSSYETAILAANYHNGPLSVLVPFGIWGVLALTWFLVAGGRVLHLNYRYGDPALKTINTALYACFLARVIFFLLFFGAFDLDIFVFTGLVGLGVSLNGRIEGLEAETEQLERANTSAEDYYLVGEK